MEETVVDIESANELGVTEAAYEEITNIIGHLPTISDISTLLAMWQSNGCQQSLIGWLKGQHHSIEREEYIYAGTFEGHKEVREPKIKECIDIAHDVAKSSHNDDHECFDIAHGQLIYMVGNVSTEFVGSEYAKLHLHLSGNPITLVDEEESQYIQLITQSLLDNEVLTGLRAIAEGGLYGTLCHLMHSSQSRCGFEIITCREVRSDAFLFGEEPGRYAVTLQEEMDDLFLSKMDDAGINCCYLGRATKGRVIVDGMDFGNIEEYQ